MTATATATDTHIESGGAVHGFDALGDNPSNGKRLVKLHCAKEGSEVEEEVLGAMRTPRALTCATCRRIDGLGALGRPTGKRTTSISVGVTLTGEMGDQLLREVAASGKSKSGLLREAWGAWVGRRGGGVLWGDVRLAFAVLRLLRGVRDREGQYSRHARAFLREAAEDAETTEFQDWMRSGAS